MQKRTGILMSLLLLAAMLLAACAGSSNNNQNGAAGTPGAVTPAGTAGANGTNGGAITPTAAGMQTNTPAAGVVGNATGNATGTAVVTGNVVGTGTPAAAGTASVTGTPGAAIPVTDNANLCQYNRLTKFTGMTVVDQANKEIGKVKDVVVVRDTRVFQSSTGASGSGNNASAQGQANGQGTSKNNGNNASSQGQANGTGTNKNGSGGVVMASRQMAAPMIDYVVVDLNQDNGGKTVLLPYQAFKFNRAASENSGAAVGATSVAAATPLAATPNGTLVATAASNNGSNANTTNDCVATLTVQPTALSKLPAFEASKVDFTAANWDQPFRSALANDGLSIPATGAGHEYGAAMLLGSHVSDVHVKNASNDDLGDVKEFLINPANGQLTYAVIGSGGILGIGQKYVIIPMSAMSWVPNGDNQKDTTGFLSLNLTKDQLQSAPTVDNLDKVDFTARGWNKALDAFWSGVGTTPGQATATPTK